MTFHYNTLTLLLIFFISGIKSIQFEYTAIQSFLLDPEYMFFYNGLYYFTDSSQTTSNTSIWYIYDPSTSQISNFTMRSLLPSNYFLLTINSAGSMLQIFQSNDAYISIQTLDPENGYSVNSTDNFPIDSNPENSQIFISVFGDKIFFSGKKITIMDSISIEIICTIDLQLPHKDFFYSNETILVNYGDLNFFSMCGDSSYTMFNRMISQITTISDNTYGLGSQGSSIQIYPLNNLDLGEVLCSYTQNGYQFFEALFTNTSVLFVAWTNATIKA